MYEFILSHKTVLRKSIRKSILASCKVGGYIWPIINSTPQFLVYIPNTKFHRYPLNSFTFVTCGRTRIYYERLLPALCTEKIIRC